MGFTRSTTTTNVHSTLGDYPSVDDGLTPEQLKARFDAPATGLKSDLNGLMGELEATTSAASVGAAPMYTGDTTGANVQAKLVALHDSISAAELGEIENDTITEMKLVESYRTSLAKKNGEVQTNLNAEKLGGKTLATIESDRTTAINAAKTEITSRQSPADTEYTIALTDSYTTTTKSFNVTTRFMMFEVYMGSLSYIPSASYAGQSLNTQIAIYDARKNVFISIDGKGGRQPRWFLESDITRIQNLSLSNGVLTLDIYGKHDGYNVIIRCMALDGLLP